MDPAELKDGLRRPDPAERLHRLPLVLIEGTPDMVRTKTRETLEIMMPGGGYVAGASHDSILPETPLENIVALYETVREHGRYSA